MNIGGNGQPATGSSLNLQSPASLAVTPDQLVTAPNLAGATSWNVTPNQTVAGQYAGLMAAGNPAIQAAQQLTLRSMSAAGGGNDLMAQNAAAMSGSDVALKIAGADAQVNASAASSNASAANSFAQQSNQIQTTIAQQNAQLHATVAQYNVQTANSFAQQANTVTATLAQIDKQFAQNQSLQTSNYANQVREGYLSSISQQQSALQNTIGMINANPNITQAQAQGAVTDAVNQFNTFVGQIGAYAAAMMPSPQASGPNGTYSNSSYAYNYIDPTNWPNASSASSATGGASTGAVPFPPSGSSPSTGSSSSVGSVAPSAKPASAASSGYQAASTGGGNEASMGNAVSGSSSQDAPGTPANANVFTGGNGVYQTVGGNVVVPSSSGGAPTVIGSPSMIDSVMGSISSMFSGSTPTGSSAQNPGFIDSANQLMAAHPWLSILASVVVPGASVVETLVRLVHWWNHRNDPKTPNASAASSSSNTTSSQPSGASGAQVYNGSSGLSTPTFNVTDNSSIFTPNTSTSLGQGTTNGNPIANGPGYGSPFKNDGTLGSPIQPQ